MKTYNVKCKCGFSTTIRSSWFSHLKRNNLEYRCKPCGIKSSFNDDRRQKLSDIMKEKWTDKSFRKSMTKASQIGLMLTDHGAEKLRLYWAKKKI